MKWTRCLLSVGQEPWAAKPSVPEALAKGTRRRRLASCHWSLLLPLVMAILVAAVPARAEQVVLETRPESP